MKYRVSARGIVVENNTVLFIEYEDEDNKTYYSLPGGGQEVNTDLAQTVQNEFLEEVGIEVSVGDILLVREFIISNPNIKIWSKGIHQLEIIFECTRVDRDSPIKTIKPDYGMKGYRWIPIDELKNHTIYPTSDLMDMIANRSVKHLISRE